MKKKSNENNDDFGDVNCTRTIWRACEGRVKATPKYPSLTFTPHPLGAEHITIYGSRTRLRSCDLLTCRLDFGCLCYCMPWLSINAMLLRLFYNNLFYSANACKCMYGWKAEWPFCSIRSHDDSICMFYHIATLHLMLILALSRSCRTIGKDGFVVTCGERRGKWLWYAADYTYSWALLLLVLMLLILLMPPVPGRSQSSRTGGVCPGSLSWD